MGTGRVFYGCVIVPVTRKGGQPSRGALVSAGHFPELITCQARAVASSGSQLASNSRPAKLLRVAISAVV